MFAVPAIAPIRMELVNEGILPALYALFTDSFLKTDVEVQQWVCEALERLCITSETSRCLSLSFCLTRFCDGVLCLVFIPGSAPYQPRPMCIKLSSCPCLRSRNPGDGVPRRLRAAGDEGDGQQRQGLQRPASLLQATGQAGPNS